MQIDSLYKKNALFLAKKNLLIANFVAYKDEDGNIWQPQLIERIKLMLVTDDCLKNGYLPAIGLSKFNEVTAKIILGKTSPAILENKVLGFSLHILQIYIDYLQIINIHTPTKVCSIKVAATFLLECLRYTTLYLSMPYDGTYVCTRVWL